MKRILSAICVVAILVGMLPMTVLAAGAETGKTSYHTLQDAVDSNVSETIVLTEDTADLVVSKDATIDLNGHNIAGVTVTGGTLYVKDSKTDDYTVADGVYGKLTNVSGNVVALDGYVKLAEDEGISFHRVDLGLESMTLRPARVGVYYTSAFSGDEVVAEAVESYGVALCIVEAPNAENMNTYSQYSVYRNFKAGKDANAADGTLLHSIMTEGNTDERNAANAATQVYGRAYIKTADGYVFGEAVSRDLQSLVEAIDAVWSTLNDKQQTAALDMYKIYKSVMSAWNIPNMTLALLAGGTEIRIPVQSENGVVTEEVTVEQDGVIITIPMGALLEAGAEQLTLTVTKKQTSDSGLEVNEGESLIPMDVHVEGLSAENTAPLTVELGKVMPENLNMGNYHIYHVEENGTNEMTLVDNDADFTAHNQYKYTLDGELTLHMATFSEVAVLAAEDNRWNGKRDYTWYDADAELLEIRNADQLAGLSAIVGGMAKTADSVEIAQDSFAGKTIKLLADISIGDTTDEDGRDVVFYPIGYYNSEGTYEKTNTAITSSFMRFEGTFDGNGNTISDFYQNTWEMKGDHNWYAATEQRYRDGMGLFGKVYGGTVKNLTVKNFQSDGEITTTGTIASYADCGATFENIAIFNCNPRVYNIGNGGIVGCVGWYANDNHENPVTFRNITVDNTNKITALWGSWDVACGGLVGQYYPTSGQSNAIANKGIRMENCHVAAQIDVFNDVCANYQYYAYRYAGILIGSVKENETINGHVYPKMDGITAENCTVHFGDWNDYYYCELVANSQASYTHDHQMSRLEQVISVDTENMRVTSLKGVTTDIPTSGSYNYVVVKAKGNDGKWIHGDGDEFAECYHFVNGAVWNHEDAGYETSIDEDGDGKVDLKEDKQHIYREFNNLVTGDGWGVTSKAVGELDGVKILDREIADSVVKFEAVNTTDSFKEGVEITVGDLFAAAKQDKVAIQQGKVQVAVSPANDLDNVSATYVADASDWTKGKLTFHGFGVAKVTITDYYYCHSTVLYLDILCAHSKTTLEGKKDALCLMSGQTGTETCDLCHNVLQVNKRIPALGHIDKDKDNVCDECKGTVHTRFYIAAKYVSGSKTYHYYMTSNLHEIVDSGLRFVVDKSLPANTALPTEIKEPSADHVFIMEQKADGSYVLKAEAYKNAEKEVVEGNNYLDWAGGNAVALTDLNNAQSLKIEAAANGTFHIYTQEGNTTIYLALFSGASYFAWYPKNQISDLYLIPAGCSHVIGSEKRDAREPNCVEEGYTGDWYCKGCGAITEYGEVIEPLGHDYKVTKQQDSTCSTVGFKTSACTRCNHTYTVVLEVKEHTLGNNQLCSVCGAEMADILKYTCPSCQTTEPVEWHPWRGGYLNTQDCDGKHYYLVRDISGRGQIHIGADKTADANGATIEVCIDLHGNNISKPRTNGTTGADGSFRAFAVYNGSTLNLMNTEQDMSIVSASYNRDRGGVINLAGKSNLNLYSGVTLQGNDPEPFRFAGGIVAVSGGTFTMYGGKLIGQEATRGGAVLVEGNGHFELKDGEITLAYAEGYQASSGGALSASHGSITISGGVIEGGNASKGGTIYVTGQDSNLTITGGTIKGGTAQHGGNIYITSAGTLTISGGTIDGGRVQAPNMSTYAYGGAVYLSDTKLVMTGGTIKNGVAYADDTPDANGNYYKAAGGGNLYVGVSEKYSVEISGGTIEGGRADYSNGGNIYLNRGELTISGTAVITDGVANRDVAPTNGGGNIYCQDRTTLNIQGGTIENGKATNSYGGNVYCRGILDISGGTISNGTAVNGGSIFISGHSNKDAELIISGGTIKNGNTVNGCAANGDAIHEDRLTWSRSIYINADNIYANSADVIVSGGQILDDDGGNAITVYNHPNSVCNEKDANGNVAKQLSVTLNSTNNNALKLMLSGKLVIVPSGTEEATIALTPRMTVDNEEAKFTKVTVNASLESGSTDKQEVSVWNTEGVVEGTWRLVTNVADLKAGDKVVIAAANQDQLYAMGKEFVETFRSDGNVDNRYMTAKCAVKQGNKILFGGDVQQFTFNTLEGEPGFCTFTNENGQYLYTGGMGTYRLSVVKDVSDNVKWTLTIDETGKLETDTKAEKYGGLIQFGMMEDGILGFSAYQKASDKTYPIAIYKWIDAPSEGGSGSVDPTEPTETTAS